MWVTIYPILTGRQPDTVANWVCMSLIAPYMLTNPVNYFFKNSVTWPRYHVTNAKSDVLGKSYFSPQKMRQLTSGFHYSTLKWILKFTYFCVFPIFTPVCPQFCSKLGVCKMFPFKSYFLKIFQVHEKNKKYRRISFLSPFQKLFTFESVTSFRVPNGAPKSQKWRKKFKICTFRQLFRQ